MRRLITALYAFALLACAGLVFAQGPLKNPNETVAKPKKSTDPATPPEETLPKIPSAYKKDKMDPNAPVYKMDV
ncbi:MAG TPA: hypothetical protein VG456_13225, partial [Candidatus Sulfopaludibacter sp.]|nr:hypothetical protein [Candidatus Sulfopaludibacter sp.]